MNTEELGAAPRRRRRVFYGWWIVLAGALATTVNAGVLFQGFGTFFLPVLHEFGGGRTGVSGVFSFARLESGILGPISGFLVDRVGSRRLMLVGIPLVGAGFIALSRANSLVQFYLVFILLITIGSGLGFMTPISAAVANWFSRRRGLAFGIVFSGVGLGGLLVPLIGWLIDTFGWRTTAVVLGFLVWSICIPIALVIRHRPEPYGYRPDGLAAPQEDNRPLHPAATLQAPPATEGLTPRQALATRAFWFIATSGAARVVVTAGLAVHAIPLMVDLGASTTTAAALWGMTALLSIPGRLGMSLLGDYFNKRYIIAVSLVILAAALLGINLATSLTQLIPLLVVYAFAFGGMATIPVALQADYFGRRNFATIRGMSNTVQMIGQVAGPLIAGLSFDLANSYGPALWAFMGLVLVSMFLILQARPPQRIRTP